MDFCYVIKVELRFGFEGLTSDKFEFRIFVCKYGFCYVIEIKLGFGFELPG